MERQVICLDTNYLVCGLVEGSAESRQLVAWTQAGETLVTAMPAWYEFLCGPVTPVQVATIRAFLQEILVFDHERAEAAARLFNAVGRRRPLRVGAMIAGSAVASGARLATGNRANFEPFTAHGLELA